MGEFEDYMADLGPIENDSTESSSSYDYGYSPDEQFSDTPENDYSFLDSVGGGEDSPYVPDSSRGFLGSLASGVGRGITNFIEMGAEAAESLGIENGVDEWAVSAREDYDFLKPTRSEYEGRGNVFTRGLRAIPEALTTSLAAAAPGAMLGAEIGSAFTPVGTAVGATLGGMAGIIGLFGLGEGHKKYEENLASGMGHDDAMKNAILTGTISAGGELVGDALAAATFGFGGKAAQLMGTSLLKATAKQGAKATAKNLLESTQSSGIKTLAKMAVGENATELGQLYAQGKVDTAYGLEGAEAGLSEYLETMVTTTGMSMLLGGAAAYVPRAKKNLIKRQLESGDPAQMEMARDVVDEEIKKSGDDELARMWNTTVDSYIRNGKPLDLDADVVEFGTKLERSGVTTINDLTSSNPDIQRKAVEEAFHSIGLNPDGSPMSEDQKKEYAQAAAEVETKRSEDYRKKSWGEKSQKLAAVEEMTAGNGPEVTNVIEPGQKEAPRKQEGILQRDIPLSNEAEEATSLLEEMRTMGDEVQETKRYFDSMESDIQESNKAKEALAAAVAGYQRWKGEKKADSNMRKDSQYAVDKAAAAKKVTEAKAREQQAREKLAANIKKYKQWREENKAYANILKDKKEAAYQAALATEQPATSKKVSEPVTSKPETKEKKNEGTLGQGLEQGDRRSSGRSRRSGAGTGESTRTTGEVSKPVQKPEVTVRKVVKKKAPKRPLISKNEETGAITRKKKETGKAAPKRKPATVKVDRAKEAKKVEEAKELSGQKDKVKSTTVVTLKPDEFLHLATGGEATINRIKKEGFQEINKDELYDEEDQAAMEYDPKKAEKATIPFLIVDKSGKVVGHDGRHRAVFGKKPMRVAILSKGQTVPSSLSPQFKKNGSPVSIEQTDKVKHDALRRYEKLSGEKVDTTTPESTLIEKEAPKEEEVSEGPMDLNDVEVTDPVAKAVVSGDKDYFKKNFTGENGGQVQAKEVREAVEQARATLPREVQSQFEYEAEGFLEDLLKREKKTGDIVWDDSIPGMITGKDKSGTEYLIAAPSGGVKRGKIYSVYTKKDGEWVESKDQFKDKEGAMASLKQEQAPESASLISKKPLKDQAADREGFTADVFKGYGPAKNYTVEHHKKGNTRYWVIRDKEGNRMTKQMRTKKEALSALDDMIGNVDAAKFSESAFNKAMRTKKPYQKAENGAALLKQASEDYRYGSWHSKLSEALHNAFSKKLEEVKVYEVDGDTIFHFNGDIYIGKDYLDRTDLHLHEVVHALTADVLNQNLDGFKGKVRELMTIARNKFLTQEQRDLLEGVKTSRDWYRMDESVREKLKRDTKGIAYALINEKEFLANAFNNKFFREAMNNVQFRKESVWGRLVNLISRALKLPLKQGSMLEEVFSLTEQIADIKAGKLTQAQYEADAAEGFGHHVEGAKELYSRILKGAEKLLISVNDRIAKIDPAIAHRMKKMEFTIMRKQMKYTKGVKGFLDAYDKLDKSKKAELDYLWNNSDEKKDKFLAMLKDLGMDGEFKKVQEVLKSLNKDYQDAGLNVYGDKGLYTPRRVKDVNGLMAYMREYSQKESSALTNIMHDKKIAIEEREAQVSSLLNTGYHRRTLAMKRPGAARKRTVAHVNQKMSRDHYHNLKDALIHHIAESVEKVEIHNVIKPRGLKGMQKTMAVYARQIEKDKAAGRTPDPKKVKWLEDAEAKMEALIEGDPTAISSYIVREHPEMNQAQEDELINLLRARFNQVGIRNKTLNSIKNLGLITALGSPLSAVTQIGDVAWSIHQHGLNNTLKAMLQKKEITKEDINFDSTIRELHDEGMPKFLEGLFKVTGFTGMDFFMKKVNMQAALNKYRDMSPEKFSKKWGDIFTNPDQVLASIKRGEVNDDVRYLLFTEVSEFQPIALSEMPEGYLTAGNGRIFYTLKSYAVKTISNIVKTAFDSTKSKPENVRNAMKLIFVATMANAGADTLKDMILGRGVDLTDEVTDSLLKLFMFSKYQTAQVSRSGPGTAAWKFLMPPALSTVDYVGRDFLNFMDADKENTYKSLKYIPVVGKIGYDRFTKGGVKDKIKRLDRKIKEYKDKGKRVPVALKRRKAALKRQLK